jgi:hypothetical protein
MIEGAIDAPWFTPAPEMRDWLLATFCDPEGKLHNPEHAHLIAAQIGVLWTSIDNSKFGRRVLAQAEFKPPGGTMGKWQRARARAQIHEWFGGELDFLLTFDARFAGTVSDRVFCAIAEHELYHCGQARDEYGVPRFSKFGMPIFTMRGHDIEEFTGIVRRYGLVHEDIRTFIEAADSEPLTAEQIDGVCGTCHA